MINIEKEKTGIIYSNFNRKNKWLGIIDYKSLVVILIYIVLVYYMLNLFNLNIEIFFYLFLFFTVPVIAVVVVSNKDETLIDMIIVILKFKLNSKIFVKKEYIKDLKNEKYKKL